MPVTRIKVTAVSDQGDDVIVWGSTEHAPNDSDPVGYAFQDKKGTHRYPALETCQKTRV